MNESHFHMKKMIPGRMLHMLKEYQRKYWIKCYMTLEFIQYSQYLSASAQCMFQCGILSYVCNTYFQRQKDFKYLHILQIKPNKGTFKLNIWLFFSDCSKIVHVIMSKGKEQTGNKFSIACICQYIHRYWNLAKIVHMWLRVRVLLVGLGVDWFLGLVGQGHSWGQKIGVKWISYWWDLTGVRRGMDITTGVRCVQQEKWI